MMVIHSFRSGRLARAALLSVLLLAPSIPWAGTHAADRPSGTPLTAGAPGASATASTPGTLWRFSTGGRQIITAPAVGPDGTVYAASSDGALYAVSRSGTRLWYLRTGITTGQTPPARPAVAPDGSSYWDLSGAVVAVTPSGQVRWVFLATGGGAPLLDHGRLLVAGSSYLYAVETSGPRAGRAAWRAAIGAAGSPTSGPTPAVGLNGVAYVPSTDGFLYAIAPSGARLWSFHVPPPPRGGAAVLYSPAVGLDGTVYLDTFSAGHGLLYALSEDGRLRWRTAIAAGSDLARGPDGTIYAATHLLAAVSPRGRTLWQVPVDASAPPVAAPDGTVLAPTLSPPSLLDIGRGGALRWRVALAAAAVAPPAVAPQTRNGMGQLYVGDYAGALTALAAGGLSAGSRGRTRLVEGTAPPGAAADLGADNLPFIVQSGRVTWRVTLGRAIERSTDGHRWRAVFTPGASLPDPRSGVYHNARYGDVAFLAVDPRHPAGLYVGTLGTLGDYLSGGAGGSDGGLYYSPNGVSGWRKLDGGLPYTYEPRLRVPTFGLDSLVFDPTRDGVLYAQTPADFGSPGHDAGLYKSSDGGRQWHAAVRGLAAVPQGNDLIGAYRAYPPGTLLVDRARPGVLFLVAPTGFYRSADAAGHWSRVGGVSYRDPASVTVRIGAGGAVTVYTDRGRYTSRDGGAHFS